VAQDKLLRPFLYPAKERPISTRTRVTRQPRSTWEWALITLLLLVAAAMRFHDLGDIPKGLEHDEVATWHMVRQVLAGEVPIYFEEGYGHEPLYNYLTALPVALFGDNWLGERFWAPWLGMLAVSATYALWRRLFGPFVALGAAGYQATVLWAFFFNRLGLRLNQLPFFLLLAAICFWRGVEGSLARPPGPGRGGARWGTARWVGWYAAAGAWIGICFYTYMSSRVVPLLFGALALYLIARDLWFAPQRLAGPGRGRALLARWWPLAVCFAVALLVMAPLLLYLGDRPPELATPQRESQVDRPLRELLAGNPRPVLENAWAIARMWNVDGERYWQLNVSHRPVFVEPVSGLLFWAGAVVILWRWREPRMALLALWIALGMVPSLLTSEAPSWPRTMLASPAALALPGLALWAGGARLRRAPSRHARRLRAAPAVLLALSLFLTAALTARDYLVRWPEQGRVRFAFQSSLTEALRYLDRAAGVEGPDPAPVVMSGLSPHDMDPWTERCTLRRDDLSIRWVDPRSALVLPAAPTVRLIALDITPVDPLLAAWAGLEGAPLLAEGPLAARGGTEHEDQAPVFYDPSFRAYLLDGEALGERIAAADREAYAGSDAARPERLEAPPAFGGLVRYAGSAWLETPRAGATVPLLTFWQALETGPSFTRYGEPALRTFVHLLDRQGAVVGGTDVLGAAPDTWQPGDWVIQLHQVPFPAQGAVRAVEVGWYAPPDGPRLSVEGGAAGDRILIPLPEVAP